MNHSKKSSSDSENANKMRALYDAAPYPAISSEIRLQPVPLLEHWINSALGHFSPSLYSEANILVAGCGSGAEALMLARHYPDASIVGLDFSEKSIERAQASANTDNLSNITFAIVDMCEESWTRKYEQFDFILCNAVADYVEDVQAFLKNLSNSLTAKGILFMTANSPFHPAVQIRKAFNKLGIAPSSFNDSPEHRSLLHSAVSMMGPNIGIESLAGAPKSYLDIDIFAPIAHHHSLSHWCKIASAAGLHFCGSMGAIEAIDQIEDRQLPAFYKLGRTSLSKWMIELRQRPGMQMLFSRTKAKELVFNDEASLLKWRPKLDACVGVLPAMQGNPNQAMNLTLQFKGHPGLQINSTAYGLEVLRNCSGTKTLAEITAAIPETGNMEGLRACLFRAYQYGLLV